MDSIFYYIGYANYVLMCDDLKIKVVCRFLHPLFTICPDATSPVETTTYGIFHPQDAIYQKELKLLIV
jgi:hypothetical protein